VKLVKYPIRSNVAPDAAILKIKLSEFSSNAAILSEFLNSVKIGNGTEICLEIAYLEVDGNYMSILTSALNDSFPKDNSQKIFTIEVCNSVDHPENFSTITSNEHFK